jgi:hypothetical protein
VPFVLLEENPLTTRGRASNRALEAVAAHPTIAFQALTFGVRAHDWDSAAHMIGKPKSAA